MTQFFFSTKAIKYSPISFAFLFFTFTSSFSQGVKDIIKVKFKNADSVILASHNLIYGVTIVDDSTGKEIPLPKLIIKNRLNQTIIKERQNITGKSLDTLINILSRPFEDKEVSYGMCFIPHHAIFIIKKGMVSYIEICFDCRRFKTSKDLNNIGSFDNRKWAELEQFFVGQGFHYELEPVAK